MHTIFHRNACPELMSTDDNQSECAILTVYQIRKARIFFEN